MPRRAPFRFAPLAAAALACALAAPAPAQIYNRPPASVPGPPGDFDVAGQGVRIDRLENQVRTLNGQIEQLQNQNRRLEEALRKFQQDVEFRFQNPTPGRPPAPGARRSDVEPIIPPAPQRSDVQPIIPPVAARPAPATPQQGRRGDAFDPAAQPGAPGAPRPLGATPPSAPLPPGAPPSSPAAANPQGPLPGAEADEPPPADGPIDLSRAARGQTRVPAPTADAAATPLSPAPATPPKSEYGAALELYRAGQYEGAEAGLKSFLQKNPKSRLAADATYYLGETYYQRGRHREAAEQYLKVSTDWAETSRAPDSMLRLGMALQAMGAREQACATLGEVARKYPAATAARRGADREMKRAGC